jgi:hypothetical protein
MKKVSAFRKATLALLLLAGASIFPVCAQLLADPVAVPDKPLPFERVSVRLIVDDCVFNPSSVRVTADQGTTQITMTPVACFAAGPVKVVDIQIGAFAEGLHRADVVVNPAAGLGPSRVWRVTFTVAGLPEIAIYPPPPKPLANQDGIWWSPEESGWGLSIHQSATRQLFMAWYVYDATGKPVWYTIQPGHWKDFRSWAGIVYRTSGPQFFASAYDPSLFMILPVGTATLSFDQTPASADTAIFTYTVDGITAEKTIRRMRL